MGLVGAIPYKKTLNRRGYGKYNCMAQHETYTTEMKTTQISRELVQMHEESDTFLVFDRTKQSFDYPVHFHPEYELNYIRGAHGATRIVGDNIETIDDYELCLVGPNLYHAWENGNSDRSTDKREITVQFVRELLSENMLHRDLFKPIGDMLHRSAQGILFSAETARRIEPLLDKLVDTKGFDSFLDFMRLLHELATSPDQRVLANASFQPSYDMHVDERIERIHKFMNDNYHHKVMLSDAAAILNMSPVSFTRFIKQRTGKSFVDYLNEIRLGYATRMMIDSDKSISEICFACGFNNISNFNRIFKKKQGQTPTDFRNNFHGVKKVY